MKLLFAALLAVLYPVNAAAQDRGIFIQAGPLLDGLFTTTIDAVAVPVGRSPRLTYTWNDLNGDRRWQPGEEETVVGGVGVIDVERSLERRFVPGVSAAAGVFITPSVSLRMEGSFHKDHVFTTTTMPLTLFRATESRQAVATTDLIVSAAWHHDESRRVTLAYQAGVVFRRQHDETTLTFRYSVLPPSGGRPSTVTDEQRFASTRYAAGVIAGVDAAIRLSPHLALVPQVRLVAANEDWNLRPGVTLRWRP